MAISTGSIQHLPQVCSMSDRYKKLSFAMPGPRSLQHIAGEQLINRLTDAVSGYQATANFSCGGFVDTNSDIFIENI